MSFPDPKSGSSLTDDKNLLSEQQYALTIWCRYGKAVLYPSLTSPPPPPPPPTPPPPPSPPPAPRSQQENVSAPVIFGSLSGARLLAELLQELERG